jgi:hypothetical protein
MRTARRGLLVTAVVAGVAAPTHTATAETPRAHLDSQYVLDAAPSASFVWFPRLPHVNERVTLVSTSTDLASPITGYGWDLTGFGAFVESSPSITTTFSTPANHAVGLRVRSADGLSAIASESIHMSPPSSSVMQPFPIVRIVGVDYANGTKIRRLEVEAGSLASIAIGCRGHGCPRASQRRVVPSSNRGVQWVRFRRFERLLRPGASLKIRVSKGALIGAYTRLTIRHHGLPVRVDSCLAPTGLKPIRCPS